MLLYFAGVRSLYTTLEPTGIRTQLSSLMRLAARSANWIGPAIILFWNRQAKGIRMGGYRRSAWALLLLLGSALPAAAQSSEDTARAVHLLRRATWGVRPADITAV